MDHAGDGSSLWIQRVGEGCKPIWDFSAHLRASSCCSSLPSTWVASQGFIHYFLASRLFLWAHPPCVQESLINNKQLKGRK